MALIMNKKASLDPAVAACCNVRFAEDLQQEKETAVTKEDQTMADSMFYSAMEVKAMLGISRGKAYQIIKNLNDELEKEGYITISGKIPKKLFAEKIYGMAR